MAGRTQGAMFQDMASFRKFALAGNAIFTLVSRKTGERFTFRVRKPREGKAHFVQVLRGPDNTSDYSYLGVMFGPGLDGDFQTYRHGGPKAKIGETAPSAQAFAWLARNVMSPRVLEQVEIWHEGRCGKCRKPLTVPESIQSGLGPICARGGRD